MRAIAAGLVVFTTIAQAQDLALPSVTIKPPTAGAVIGAGNLPLDFYPKSPCIKPDTASIGDKPKDARDVKAVQEFNQRVQSYNKTAATFNTCVVDYAAKANNDIARIQAAIRDANGR